MAANMAVRSMYIFTNKLSKMVAQYENLRDMFDLNTSFDINTVETLEKKIFSIMDKIYWQEKPCAQLTLMISAARMKFELATI